jgi:hypothetical protein
MAIYRLLQNSPLGPEEISRLVLAYERTLKALGLKDRSDPITQMVAKKIIEIGQTGVRDPLQLATLAVRELAGDPMSGAAAPGDASHATG